MLLSRDAIAAGVGTCGPDDFYRPSHGDIFEAICALYGANDPADVVTVADELRRRGRLDECGGDAALVALQVRTPATSRAQAYADIVREHSTLRALIGAGAEIAEMGYSLPTDVEKVVDEAETALMSVASRGRRRRTAVDLGPSLSAWFDDVAEANEAQTLPGISTGWYDVDALVGGLRPGQLVTIAGRPSMGKTATACQLCLNAAGAGNLVLFVSLEMSLRDLQDRFMAAASRLDLARIRDPRHLAPKDFEHLTNAMATLDLPITIEDDPGATVMSVRSSARRLARQNLGLVIVDYLQLMTSSTKAENRQVEVAEMSRALKKAALDLEVPIVALAQLNRGVETRADKRPMLADLRESGAIENDSDIVAFLYRDEMYRPGSEDTGVMEVHVAKNRNGPTGTARLAYQPQVGTIVNMVRI